MSKMSEQLINIVRYPPKEAANALETVIKQCEQWTDNEQEHYLTKSAKIYEIHEEDIQMAAEP